VARYHLVPANYSSAGQSPGFLDVSFGKLPQLIGYETSMRRLLAGLELPLAERLRSEIRLAKSLLRRVGGIYGTSVRGLRAHAVEQWVIQSFNYRASGLGVGTLENALRLIVEEGCSSGRDGSRGALPFEDFKTRFPLRHLGWWEIEEPHSDRRAVNLWDLLGDGDRTLAASKWETFVALAEMFDRLRTHDSAWDITKGAVLQRPLQLLTLAKVAATLIAPPPDARTGLHRASPQPAAFAIVVTVAEVERYAGRPKIPVSANYAIPIDTSSPTTIASTFDRDI
jgi:hypothetical protein